jgi:hypothetical protein
MSASSRPSVIALAMLRREAVPWALLGLTLGLVEGATAAILVKQQFAVSSTPLAVNLAVAFLSGAPALSNVVSFIWANWAHGRSRVQILILLQCAFAVVVGAVALAPVGTGGLITIVLAVIAARMLWAGLLTIRAVVWSANYPRTVLARITGKIVIISSLTVAMSAAVIGWTLHTQRFDHRWLYVGGAIAGLLAAWLYRRVRVRHEFKLLHAESQFGTSSSAFTLRTLREILRHDRVFRSYMFWMGLFGGGNLMLTAQLVLIFSEQLRLSSAWQIALLSVVPLLALPLFMRGWARLFDRTHIIVYRAQQAWVLVLAVLTFCIGIAAESLPVLCLASVLLGAAYAGANLGWNLGHNDFATTGSAQHYMGVHVTLTGVRGAIAPPIGVLCYQFFERWSAGTGRLALLLPLLMTVAGAMGFNSMRKVMEKQ